MRTPVGVVVRLDDRSLKFIEAKHPEMRGNRTSLIEALEAPDLLLRVEERGRYIALKSRTSRPGLSLVAVYDGGGRLITAYKTKEAERLVRRYRGLDRG